MAKERIDIIFYDKKGLGEQLKPMTRQEAIERMAMGLHFRSTVISNMEKDWEKLDKSWQDSFCKYAEAALNALLEADNGGH